MNTMYNQSYSDNSTRPNSYRETPTSPLKNSLATTVVFIIGISCSEPSRSESNYIEPILENQKIFNPSRQDLKLIAEIREKSSYQDNWDGNGAIKPKDEAIKEAVNFIRNLSSKHQIHSPIISLASDGEVNLLWKLHNFELDLGFYGDNTYSYYGSTQEGKEFMSDSTSSLVELPSEIINLIIA